MSIGAAFLVTVLIPPGDHHDLGRRYLLAPDGTTLGNSAEADILLRLDSSTPCHVRLRQEDDSWYLVDLAEFSGAYINGLIVQNSQIFDGDILQIGSLGFEFCSGTGIKIGYFEQIEHLLQEDFLTRAYNRSFSMNLLQLEVSRYNRWLTDEKDPFSPRRPNPISLIFIDTDNFGMINKKYGHAVGDGVLREMVRRVKLGLRPTDIIARYGGEEFVVVLLDTPLDYAKETAEEIRQSIANTPFLVDEQRAVEMTVSCGVSELEAGMDANALVQSADAKMRLAKNQGKNRIVV